VATEFREFVVTCPTGILPANPQVTNISMPPRVVEKVRVRVPPGPRGNMGFAIGAGGLQLIPQQQGQFIIADDETIDLDLTTTIDSGAWQVFMVNNGTYSHSIYVTFAVNLVRDQATPLQRAQPDLSGVEV
jgi:hypothetical protein